MIFDVFDPEAEPPAVGDLVVTARLVRIVTEVRPVESRVWHDRWRLDLRRLGPREPWPRAAVEAALAEGARCHYVRMYRRGESPSDVAREFGFPVRAG